LLEGPVLQRPAGLADLLQAYPGQIGSIRSDAAGRNWLFVSSVDLTGEDGNGLSDVYLYDAGSDRIEPISVTPEFVTGNGESASPGMDDEGRFAVFASAADDLTRGDDNGVRDVFVRDLHYQVTERISAAPDDQAAGRPADHPAIDGEGREILFDQQDADGVQRIVSHQPGEAVSIIASPEQVDAEGAQQIRYHHPSLSADGRFVAYLRTDEIPWQRLCQVIVLDRWRGQSVEDSCSSTTGTEVRLYPTISRNGARVEWFQRPDGAPAANDPVFSFANPLWSQ
jgi:Tol biopolymer transport system component